MHVAVMGVPTVISWFLMVDVECGLEHSLVSVVCRVLSLTSDHCHVIEDMSLYTPSVQNVRSSFMWEVHSVE